MYSLITAGNHGHIAPIVNDTAFIRKLSKTEYMNLLSGEICNYELKTEKSYGNLCKAKQKCIDLIHNNLTPRSIFLTITTKENIQDRERYFSYMNKFSRTEIFRKCFGTSYLYTVEKQKRGALHSHFICFEPVRDDKGHLPYSDLIKAWRLVISGIGSVKVVKIDDPDHIGKYLSKYILKEFASVERHKRVYVPSKGLKQPLKSQIDYKEFKALIDKHKAKEKKATIDGEEKIVGWYW